MTANQRYRVAWMHHEGEMHVAKEMLGQLREALPQRTGAHAEAIQSAITAVERLPDRTAWNALPDRLRETLDKSFKQMELRYHADQVINTIREEFPEIDK